MRDDRSTRWILDGELVRHLVHPPRGLHLNGEMQLQRLHVHSERIGRVVHHFGARNEYCGVGAGAGSHHRALSDVREHPRGVHVLLRELRRVQGRDALGVGIDVAIRSIHVVHQVVSRTTTVSQIRCVAACGVEVGPDEAMGHIHARDLKHLVAMEHHDAEEGEAHDAGHADEVHGDERLVVRFHQLDRFVGEHFNEVTPHEIHYCHVVRAVAAVVPLAAAAAPGAPLPLRCIEPARGKSTS
mmetsp:Transcript_20561/g.51047  ORF Transcript_20561/g.51047 Transcript_20561/m.51047 type:complete len:242 (+) Transcript_20561:1217-1942(+)